MELRLDGLTAVGEPADLVGVQLGSPLEEVEDQRAHLQLGEGAVRDELKPAGLRIGEEPLLEVNIGTVEVEDERRVDERGDEVQGVSAIRH